MQSFSLFDLNEYIRRVVALNFPETFWVHAEISQINESRGQYYIDLIEKSVKSDEVVAKSSAVIWYKSVLFLRKKLGDLLDPILQNGTEVKFKVSVDYNERYGLKLVVEDIDLTYTIGQLEINRQKVIERLKKENLLEKNTLTEVPSVIQRIAVLSSGRAAGYQDFVEQLTNNPYGYTYTIDLYDSAVQGKNVSNDICNALRSIEEIVYKYDAIVIIRGGGSKLDLSGFDDYNIGSNIAKSSIPVFTGIGHDIDNTIADLVAHTSIKTPTAVANFLIDHNAMFEGTINHIAETIQASILQRISKETYALQEFQLQLVSLPSSLLQKEKSTLENIRLMLDQEAKNTLQQAVNNLEYSEKLIEAHSIENILKRGFGYIQKKGKIVSDVKTLKPKDLIEIHHQDAIIESTIKTIR